MALFVVCGAQVTTFDHHQWLEPDSFRHSVKLIRDNLAAVEAEARKHCPDFATNLVALEAACTGGGAIRDILARAGVDYRITHNACPDSIEPVDLLYTESVLQRLPIGDVARVLGRALSLLKDTGATFHRIDQRDINTLAHVGNGRWALEYLKYPEWFFRSFISGRFTSQNRLRESDWLNLLRHSGVAATYIESRSVDGDAERMQAFRPAARFRHKTAEDMATRCSLIIGRKGAGGEAVRHRIVASEAEVEG